MLIRTFYCFGGINPDLLNQVEKANWFEIPRGLKNSGVKSQL